MADQSNILKEFIVSIGFNIDEGKLKEVAEKVTKSLGSMVEAADSAFTGMAKGITAIVGTFTGAFFAIDRFVDSIAKRFEQLYYSAQRAGTSVGSMFAIQRAGATIGMENLGATAEQFGTALRVNPGQAGLVRSLGVSVEGRDPTRVMLDSIAALGRMAARGQTTQATLLGGQLGLGSPGQVLQLIENLPKLTSEYEEQLKHAKELGEQAEKLKAYRQAVEHFNTQMQLLGAQMASAAAPALERFYTFLGRMIDQLEKSGKLQQIFDQVEQSLENLVTYLTAHQSDIEKVFTEILIPLTMKALQLLKETGQEWTALTEKWKAFVQWLKDHTPAWLQNLLPKEQEPKGTQIYGQATAEKLADATQKLNQVISTNNPIENFADWMKKGHMGGFWEGKDVGGYRGRTGEGAPVAEGWQKFMSQFTGSDAERMAQEFIKKSENVKKAFYEVYDDMGKAAIGYGHRLQAGEEWMRQGVTAEQAESIFQKDYAKHKANVLRLTGGMKLNEGMVGALTSLDYNLSGGLGAAKTLLSKLMSGDFEGAAKSFELYSRAGGMVNPGLLSRRMQEEAMFRQGMQVQLHQTTNIHVNGSADARATAQIVRQQQDAVNRNMVRDMQTKVA